MKRHALFLRGVSPMNCKMAELAADLRSAGFEDVKTVLSSGNAVFRASGTPAALQKKCEAAMQQHLGRSFRSFVRPVDTLERMIEADPFSRFRLPPGAKRVVTFLAAAPRPVPRLPIAFEDAKILAVEGREMFCAYVPGPNWPSFMALIEKTFGKEVTTRTWDTVRKVCAAARPAG